MVDLENQFVAYMGVAVVLFAMRETKKIPQIYIPIVAICLGVAFAFWESGNFEFTTFLAGLQYALMGMGTVAGVKYTLETKSIDQKERNNIE